MTLTKAELSAILLYKLGFSKMEANHFVDGFFDEMKKNLSQGEGIKLPGFGKFQVKDKGSRPGRNPKTGEEILVQARKVVTFHASSKLKDYVDNGNRKNRCQSSLNLDIPVIQNKKIDSFEENVTQEMHVEVLLSE